MDFKNTLRKEIEQKLNTLENKREKSENITKNISSMPIWEKSSKLFLYISFKNEVDTTSLIKEAINQGKEVYAPLIKGKTMSFFRIDNLNKDKLIKSSFGILEPPKGLPEFFPDKNSIMIIPGVAFSKTGERLGRGGGYYDKYLEKYNNMIKIAVTFNVQICESIPTNDWDKKVDFVVTEDKIYRR